jgi:acetolactate synthase-1/2/3 large subunit
LAGGRRRRYFLAMADAPVTTAARRLVDCLAAHGTTHVFCVPGESYLAVLDALADVRDQIQLVVCRHEAAAANMAVAHGKLTGRPGVCFVTRGPGATHASIGVHTAQQDSAPMLLFVGQIARGDRGRGAFQEVDYAAVFGTLAKLAFEIDEADRMAEQVDRAFSVAVAGRPGPVVIALPEDMLVEDAGPRLPSPTAPSSAALTAETLKVIETRLAAAERPLMILGGVGWTEQALDGLAAWAEGLQLPVALSFRRKDLLDNDHPCYIGDLGLGPNPGLLDCVRQADLILAIGARLGDNPTQGYSLLDPTLTAERLIHIHASGEELGRVWPAAVAGVADSAQAAIQISAVRIARTWPEWRAAGRVSYEAFTRPIAVEGPVNLSEVYAHMAEVLPADAIVCNGAGNYAAWLHRFYRHRRLGTQLAPTSGAMGFGFPAAIGAKLIYPEREVVALAGDGCFQMALQELATAVQYDARVVVVVVDNGSYGTIRMHQEREYPGRISGTDIVNPDFTALALAYGAHAATVERTEDFPAAFATARAAGRPALIHLKTSVEQIAPGRTITQLRAGRA